MADLPIYSTTAARKGLSSAVKAGEKTDRDKLKKTCADFESILIQQVMKSMRQSLISSGFGGNGAGNDMVLSLFDQELSQALAKRGGLGLGEMMYRRMVQQDERRETSSAGTDGMQTDLRLLRRK